MKVLLDLTSLADNFSGIERYAASLAFEMIKDEETQFILVFKSAVHEIFMENIHKNNVEVVVLNRCNKLFFNQIRLPNAIRKIKADYYLFLAFPVPFFLFKKNMISTIHDICCWDCPETMKGMSKWYFRISHFIALKKCKTIITISDFSKERIMCKWNYNESNILKIYCGVDKKFLQYKKNSSRIKVVREKYCLPSNYILSLSTLEPRKNLQLLIDAYRDLVLENKIDVSLVLAGRKGWKMEEVLKSVEKDVQDKIIFTGFINDEDLPFVYGEADLFVFPSIYEGFGMPPLEAIACGSDVVSSNSSCLPEILEDSVIYFENNNKEDLKKKIINPPKISLEKKRKQVKKYSWEIESQRLLKYLKKEDRKWSH